MIPDHRLPGGYRFLRSIEHHLDCAIVIGRDDAWSLMMSISYLPENSNGCLRWSGGDPMRILCGDATCQKVLLVSYDYPMREGVEIDDIVWAMRRDTDTPPLPDGEPIDSMMSPYYSSPGVDDLSSRRVCFLLSSTEILPVVAMGDEADFLALPPLGYGQTLLTGHGTDLGLGESANGQEYPG